MPMALLNDSGSNTLMSDERPIRVPALRARGFDFGTVCRNGG
jgi:hypothetical protein